MNSLRCCLMFLALLSTAGTLLCQYPLWQIDLASGEKLEACSIDSLHGSTVWVKCAGEQKLLQVDTITRLYRHKDSHAVTGMVIGTFVGAFASIVIIGTSHPQGFGDLYLDEGAIVGMPIIGAGTGALVGAATGSTEDYDLNEASARTKAQTVWLILQDQKGGV